MLAVLVFVVSLVGAGVLAYAAIILLKTLNRRLDGGTPLNQAQLDAIHARLAGTELMEARVEELEQRLDFAERLISQHEPERLPSPDHR